MLFYYVLQRRYWDGPRYGDGGEEKDGRAGYNLLLRVPDLDSAGSAFVSDLGFAQAAICLFKEAIEG